MVPFQQALAFFVLRLVAPAIALPEPHRGMLDNMDTRDVGIVYTRRDFQGEKRFIFEHKTDTDCQQLYLPHQHRFEALSNLS
jgi:hypothetical protein